MFAVPYRRLCSAEAAYHEKPKFQSETTYRASFVKPTTPEMMKYVTKKPLVPYSASSTRNTLPVRFPNEPVPYKRFCKPNNVTQFV